MELSKVVKEKQTLDQMQKDAKTKYESKGLDMEIVSVTKAITIFRKRKWTDTVALQCKSRSSATEEMRRWKEKLKLINKGLEKRNVRRPGHGLESQKKILTAVL